MPLHLNAEASTDNRFDPVELRMREALGLHGRPVSGLPQQRPEQARQRHRFARDGEVPVVVLGARKVQDTSPAPDHPIAELQAALDSERAARVGAERALQEAQAAIQKLQARLAHAELAHSEAFAAERASREQAERGLQEAVTVRDSAERQLRERTVLAPPESRKPARTASAAKAPLIHKAREPQPVQWWLPSYRAKMSKR